MSTERTFEYILQAIIWAIICVLSALIIVILIGAMGGCASRPTRDFLKDLESGAYDSAALAVSQYCERLDSPLATQERLEARREIRQRGAFGPLGPLAPVPGLDEKTAEGQGPVVRIWCKDEAVPGEVWEGLVR